MLNQKEEKTKSKRVSMKQLKLREELWPEIDTSMIYTVKKEKGWTTIPRTMPLILRIMDDLSNGKPVSSTFLSLWCRVWDWGIIRLVSPKEVSFEAGFTGERAETSWRARMKILCDLGFIDAKPGSTGDYHNILVFNPQKVIEKLKAENKLKPTKLYYAYYERLLDVGASNDPEERA